jgi:hypothetical protein
VPKDTPSPRPRGAAAWACRGRRKRRKNLRHVLVVLERGLLVAPVADVGFDVDHRRADLVDEMGEVRQAA